MIPKNTLEPIVCKITEERERMVKYILDSDVNEILRVPKDAIEGLKKYIPYLSYSALNQIEEDMQEVYQEIRLDHSYNQ